MRREMQVSVCSVIMTGYNILMPEKRVKIHRNDPPWISEELKHLTTLRQRAFSSGNNSIGTRSTERRNPAEGSILPPNLSSLNRRTKRPGV